MEKTNHNYNQKDCVAVIIEIIKENRLQLNNNKLYPLKKYIKVFEFLSFPFFLLLIKIKKIELKNSIFSFNLFKKNTRDTSFLISAIFFFTQLKKNIYKAFLLQNRFSFLLIFKIYNLIKSILLFYFLFFKTKYSLKFPFIRFKMNSNKKVGSASFSIEISNDEMIFTDDQ